MSGGPSLHSLYFMGDAGAFSSPGVMLRGALLRHTPGQPLIGKMFAGGNRPAGQHNPDPHRHAMRVASALAFSGPTMATVTRAMASRAGQLATSPLAFAAPPLETSGGSDVPSFGTGFAPRPPQPLDNSTPAPVPIPTPVLTPPSPPPPDGTPIGTPQQGTTNAPPSDNTPLLVGAGLVLAFLFFGRKEKRRRR